MPPKAKSERASFVDGISQLDGGMNAGVVPQALPPNQVAMATNCTFRGGYVTHRPILRKVALSFGGSVSLQALFENCQFQGAAYYKPDVGYESLCAAIGGRLFQVSITPSAAPVTDVTPQGDANNPTAIQAWLWQAERWLIWNDGTALPIFFDGSSSRRSKGAATQLAVTAGPFTAPAIGGTVNVSLVANYNGPFDVPVTVLGGQYIIQAVATANARMTLLSGPGGTIAAGTQVVAIPSRIGITIGASTVFPLGFGQTQLEFYTALTTTEIPRNVTWTIGGSKTLFVGAFIPTQPSTFVIDQIGAFNPSLNGTSGEIITYTNPNPNTVVGTVTTAFASPAALNSVDVLLDAPYSGPDGQQVWIGDSLWAISKIPAGPGATSVDLVNQTETPGTIIPPGTPIMSLPELPAGRMGDYGLGRVWMSLVDGRSFIGGDIVGGSSGTAIYSNRDAVLRVTENTFLFGGGVFVIPGSSGDIRAMRFAATLDASLGQGALQVFTQTRAFSCNAPVDRTTWQSITNPILTQSLLGGGALSQSGTINVNGDIIMRSTDGARSLILARREFNTWGNVPQSREIDPLLALDDQSLTQYEDAAEFDNRYLLSVFPTNGPRGTYRQGMIALNFDPISNLRGKAPSIYDGLWTGVNVLAMVQGLFAGVQRAFAFTYNASDFKIELWEIVRSGDGIYDNDQVPITWSFESAALFKQVKGKGVFDQIELADGEIHVSDVIGTVRFQVHYKADWDNCWHHWHSFTICANNNNTGPAQYRTRLGLGQPDVNDCDTVNNKLARIGSLFQIRVQVTGHCKIMGVLIKAFESPEPEFAPIICDEVCQ